MQNDGDFRPISPEDFARRANGSALHPIESQLLFAAAEGLAPNLSRQIAFAGISFPCELQVLGFRRYAGDNYERARAAHATDFGNAVALCAEAETWTCSGTYLLPAVLRDGVETRMALPGAWFDQQKGRGTTDSDIEARLLFAIDFDVKRPSNTSATSSEMLSSARVATRAWEYLAGLLGGTEPLAYVHSGNGRQIHVALEHLEPEASRKPISALLIGLDAIFSTPEVCVDRKLFDAKRILPACGTTKRKGAAGSDDRPHRQTAIVTGEVLRRLTLEELTALTRAVWHDTTPESRKEMEAALGIKSTLAVFSPAADSPFAKANAVEPADVAAWIGVVDSEGHATCPGCGNTSGVAVLNHGFKCSHNTCSGKGRQGFRTNVDLVAEIKDIPPYEAVARISERFDLNLPPVAAPSAEDVSFAPSPSTPITETRMQVVDESWLHVKPEPRKYLAIDTRTQLGALDAEGVCLFVAAGGVGKSYATIALALAIASHTPWLGTFQSEAPGRVLIVSAEESTDEIKRRLYYVAQSTGVVSLGAGIEILDVHNVQVPLLDENYRMTEHAAALVSLVQQRGPYALVVMDPLSRLAGASIDADNVAAGLMVSALEAISSAAKGLVVVAHHTDKVARREGIVDATAVRGATGLGDSARMVMMLSSKRVSDEEIITLTRAKANHVPFWKNVELRRGVHGELLPLPPEEGEELQAKQVAQDPARMRAAEREESRAALAAQEAETSRMKAEEQARLALERELAEDEVARVIEREHGTSLSYRAWCDEMRARLGGCSKDRAAAARLRIAHKSKD
jgi:RecA-family ATPase